VYVDQILYCIAALLMHTEGSTTSPWTPQLPISKTLSGGSRNQQFFWGQGILETKLRTNRPYKPITMLVGAFNGNFNRKHDYGAHLIIIHKHLLSCYFTNCNYSKFAVEEYLFRLIDHKIDCKTCIIQQ